MKEADGSGAPGCQGQAQIPKDGEDPVCTQLCLPQHDHGSVCTTAARNGERLYNRSGGGPDESRRELGISTSNIRRGPNSQLAGSAGISFFDAVDKQLGLKLEPQRVTLPVIVVDSVNQKPTDNPPGVTTSLPPPPPAEFEVASIKPSAPSISGQGTAGYRTTEMRSARLDAKEPDHHRLEHQ